MTKQTRSPIEQLRLAQPSHPRLPKRLRVQLQVVEPPHRAAKDVAAGLHRGFPCTWIDSDQDTHQFLGSSELESTRGQASVQQVST